jgi:hypothetical protein
VGPKVMLALKRKVMKVTGRKDYSNSIFVDEDCNNQ